MFTDEDMPWIKYLVLDNETLDSHLRDDTPQEIRKTYENYMEKNRLLAERGEFFPK